jgi:hypothetical protein
MNKITHVYLKSEAWARATLGRSQERIGTDAPADVLDDIAWETVTEDPPGVVVVSCPYPEVQPRFEEVMQKRRYAPDRLKFLHNTPITKEINVPARVAHQTALVCAGTGNKNVIDVEAAPAHTEQLTLERRLHLGTQRNMIAVKAHLVEANASMLVIVDPNEEEADLKWLPQLRKELPHLNVVIFYRYCDRWGVVYEGGEVDPDDAWDTKSEVEQEDDLPWVIKHLAHKGESTWFGALPKVGKTWVLLCIVKALLTGWSLFGDERFEVDKAKRVIYLCPEAGRGSIKKRLKLLGLIEHLYDPITNPDGGLYLQTLSKKKIALTDPLLLALAKGADVFIDTAVRYLEGSENDVEHVKVLTENVLNLLSIGARSVWVAHHSAKGFENANTMTLGNMFRGSGEFGAAGTNFYGLCTEDAPTTTIRFHCICGRDLDELIPDMILQGRPHLATIGNFKVVDDNAEPFAGVGKKPGRPADPAKAQLTLDIAKLRDIDGKTFKEIASVVEVPESTVRRYYKESQEFDSEQKEKNSETE